VLRCTPCCRSRPANVELFVHAGWLAPCDGGAHGCAAAVGALHLCLQDPGVLQPPALLFVRRCRGASVGWLQLQQQNSAFPLCTAGRREGQHAPLAGVQASRCSNATRMLLVLLLPALFTCGHSCRCQPAVLNVLLWIPPLSCPCAPHQARLHQAVTAGNEWTVLLPADSACL
jgi:hypothetical protein